MIWDMIYLFRFFVLESTYHIIFNFDRTSQKNQRLNGQKYDSNPRPETFPYIYIYPYSFLSSRRSPHAKNITFRFRQPKCRQPARFTNGNGNGLSSLPGCFQLQTSMIPPQRFRKGLQKCDYFRIKKLSNTLRKSFRFQVSGRHSESLGFALAIWSNMPSASQKQLVMQWNSAPKEP